LTVIETSHPGETLNLKLLYGVILYYVWHPNRERGNIRVGVLDSGPNGEQASFFELYLSSTSRWI